MGRIVFMSFVGRLFFMFFIVMDKNFKFLRVFFNIGFLFNESLWFGVNRYLF